ncbi:hypothetical protein GOP47_0021626 [Adiantum capillus-veneris]|uniref:Scarecrow-like protein 21 n=1 Tax=Adiantum capillus-veneris TaxID=13818 RepID=A0A9D4U7S4_ADICA|nr:hypothetical protein GOP47_0021626 [Adiantum capillus-veneris]
MNQHKGNIHARLAPFSLSASSASSSSTPFPLPSPPLSASSSSSAPSPYPLDQCVSLLKFHASQRAHRALNLRTFPPLSPQESSTLSFSDSSNNSPLQRVDPHRLLQPEPCVQSHHSCPSPVSSFFSNGDTYSSSTRVPASMAVQPYRAPPPPPPLSHKGNCSNFPFSDLPIVRGPAAFQMPAQSKQAHRLEGDVRPVEGAKRLKLLSLEDIEKELLGDNLDHTGPASFFVDASASPALEADLPVALVEEEPLIERDWTEVIEDLLSAESSSHNTALENSTITSINSKSSTLPAHALSSPNGTGNPRELLLACAHAVDNSEFSSARTLLSALEQSVSILGDPLQRVSAYMVEGLGARMELLLDGVSNRLSKMMKDPSPADILKGTQVLYRWCPYFKFGYLAANGAIADAFRNEPNVHIIDFDIGQGNQWQTLIGAFSGRPGGPPNVRITGVADPKVPTSLEGVRRRLEDAARRAEVPFEFKPLQMDVSQVEPYMLDRREGEALAVNFAFHLHRMPDESVSTTNPRDSLLRKVKAMHPKIVTLVEHDANTNTTPFYPRFVETLNYFNAVFESLDVALPWDSKERVNAEQHCLARDIVNIVACEGAKRLQRYEMAGKWRVRMTMAGFRSLPLSSYINRTIKDLLQKYSANYKLREEGGALHLNWLERGLVAASAWQ